MPQTCSICRHAERAAIDEALVRNTPLRKIAAKVKTSPTALHRHRKHLATQLVAARQAEEVTEASSLLDRVEKLIKESEQIAAAAKLQRDWAAATGALREARGCIELLGKLRGELQQPGSLHLHRHAHLHTGSVPKTEVEVDYEIAKQVAAATAGFDPTEIARLKRLSESTIGANALN